MISSTNSGDVAILVEGAQGNVLQLSMRRVHDLAAFCAMYEFEDVVSAVTEADRVEVLDFPAIEFARRGYRLGRMVGLPPRLATTLAPRLRTPRLTRDYELFFPVFNHPFELFALAAVPDWRKRCRVAACLVSEIWIQELPEYLIELLADFDHLFIAGQHAVQDVSRVVGRPCTYLPLAANVTRFSPFPDLPPRSIDVINIGRRSAVTHRALLDLAKKRRLFYYYDTVRPSGPRAKQITFSVGDPAEHRELLANLLRRSRYYLAYRSRVNEPEQTEGREEISGKFYEGVAAGAVLLGEAPRSEGFLKQFGWPDVVLPLPFDSPGIGDVLADLDRDPVRLERIRRTNVHHAALGHDWLHRLQVVFGAAGLPPTPAMLEREQQLRKLATVALGTDPGSTTRSAAAASVS